MFPRRVRSMCLSFADEPCKFMTYSPILHTNGPLLFLLSDRIDVVISVMQIMKTAISVTCMFTERGIQGELASTAAASSARCLLDGFIHRTESLDDLSCLQFTASVLPECDIFASI